MKVCYCCKQEKPLSEFPENRKRPDGRNSLCKACKKIYNATYYERTKERHNPARRERQRRARAEVREKVYEYLRSHPCVDCGETDIVVLDFDHLSDKVAGICQMIQDGKNWPMILAEIAKCEVVCANDHRRRTAIAFGWHKAAQAPLAQLVRAADS